MEVVWQDLACVTADFLRREAAVTQARRDPNSVVISQSLELLGLILTKKPGKIQILRTSWRF